MASQPTRRHKRPIVLSSDDEEGLDAPSQCMSETVNGLKSQFKTRRVNGDPSNSQSLSKRSRPQTRLSTLKPRTATSAQPTLPESRDHSSGRKPKAHKKERTESLHDYFNAADFHRPQVEALINKAEVENEEDVIEDDASELAFLRHPSQRNTTRFVLDRRKQHIVSRPRTPDPVNTKKQQNSSQVFIIPEKASSRKPSQEPVNSLDTRSLTPWAEQYGPVCLEELMVHKKKVADVQNWMEKFWQEGNRKVWLSRTCDSA
jgi:cell cycle checkpoint protein